MTRSWIASANEQDCDYPVHNLPFGVFRRGQAEAFRCATAIGDRVVDLASLKKAGLVSAGGHEPVFDRQELNAFMAFGPAAWRRVREQLTDLLAEGGSTRLRDDEALQALAIAPIARAELALPFQVSGYTDFYSSHHHASNVGTMFRGPENALPPNWLHMPIGYNGRASTAAVSETPIVRPLGQYKPPDAAAPVFGPSRRLDLELGSVIGTASVMGRPLTVAEADDMIFGYVLLNDWSARDIQAWENVPLGPFQAKAFATTITPWVVTKAALEPFRVSTPPRDQPLLPYLREPRALFYDIELEVGLRPAGAAKEPVTSRTNFWHMYFSAAQQLAHHAVGGCRMNTGDLLGFGTISGPDDEQYGSLLELSWGGKKPVSLESGAQRSFLEDGDTLTIRGWSQGREVRIGFGECTGTIAPSPQEPD
jgi:fumarylacetoacetase